MKSWKQTLKRLSRPFAFAFPLTFILLCLALFWAYQNTPKPSTSSFEKKDKAIKSDYVFSTPSNGSLIKTIKITLNYHEKDAALIQLPTDKAKNIKQKQDVILYSKEGITMPLGGVVTDINSSNGTTQITIGLPKDTNSELLSTDAEIITLDSPLSQRYPIDALQKDKNDNKFVWTVEETDDKNTFRTKKTWTDFAIIGRDYFVAGPPINSWHFVIINPDDRITNNETYTMSQVAFKAPTQNPIKESLRQFKTKLQQKRKEALKKDAQDCRAAGKQSQTPPTAPKATSCTRNTSSTPSTPEEIFQSILSRQPGGGNCSSCSN